MVTTGFNTQPYNPKQELPYSAVQDPDGTVRMPVSQGIPLLGNVTAFKTVNVNSIVADGTTVYTAPGNKTYYVMGMVITNTDGSPHGFEYDVGGTIFSMTLGGSETLPIGNGQFPIAIVQSADNIVLTSNGGSTPYGKANFWGYEMFGQTS